MLYIGRENLTRQTTLKRPVVTGEKADQTNVPSAAHELDETELIHDLEIEQAEEAEAVKGGGLGSGKITFNPFNITRR